MNDDKKIQQRIRALLALAQDEGASASEREVAMKRASVLMARHAITSLDVEAAERERIEVRELVLRGGRSTASYATCVAIVKAREQRTLQAQQSPAPAPAPRRVHPRVRHRRRRCGARNPDDGPHRGLRRRRPDAGPRRALARSAPRRMGRKTEPSARGPAHVQRRHPSRGLQRRARLGPGRPHNQCSRNRPPENHLPLKGQEDHG